jgi:hypothetical protein
VNLFFKARCFSGNIDVEKANADAPAAQAMANKKKRLPVY